MNPATKAETAPGQKSGTSEIRTPEGDHKQLIQRVVPAIKEAMPTIAPNYTEAHAMPAGTQPIPIGEARQRLHPGINAESSINIADIKDRAEKLVGHTINSAGAMVGIEEPSFPMETVSGSNVVSIMKKKNGIKERMKNLLHMNKAA